LRHSVDTNWGTLLSAVLLILQQVAYRVFLLRGDGDLVLSIALLFMTVARMPNILL